MTFSVAFIARDFGLVANDTRLVSQSVETGLLIRHSDNGRKVHPIADGWVTGGTYQEFAPWVAHHLLDFQAIRSPEWLREELESITPARDERYNQNIFVVQHDPDGFAIYQLDLVRQDFRRTVNWHVECIEPATVSVEGGTEAQQQTVHEATEAFRARWCPRFVENRRDDDLNLFDVLRDLGGLYSELYGILGEHGSLSPLLHVGALVRDADGEIQQRTLEPYPAAGLAGLSDADLDQLLVIAEPAIARGVAVDSVSLLKPTIRDGQPVFRGDHLFVQWTGDSKVLSVKVATNTSSQPAAGTGTASNGQNGEYDSGAFHYGESAYITITPYGGLSATGVQGEAFFTKYRLPYIETLIDPGTGKPKRDSVYTDGRFTLKASDTVGKETDDDLFIDATKTLKVGTVASPSVITKTLRVPHGILVPNGSTMQWVFTTAYVQPGAAGTEADFVGAIPLPKGVTVTTFRSRMYRNAVGDFARAELFKVVTESPASLAQLTHSSTGYQTQSSSISQLVGNEEYIVSVRLTGAAAADARYVWVELDYTMPSYDKGI